MREKKTTRAAKHFCEMRMFQTLNAAVEASFRSSAEGWTRKLRFFEPYLPAIVLRVPVPRVNASPAPARRGKPAPRPFARGGKTCIPAAQDRCRAACKGRFDRSNSRLARTPETQTFPRSRETRAKARRTSARARAPASCVCRTPLRLRARPPAPSTSRGERRTSGRCRTSRARTAEIAPQARGFVSFVSCGAPLPFRMSPQKNSSVRIM